MTSIHKCHTTCPHVIARASTTWIQLVISTMAEAMSVPYCCSENNRNLSTDTVMRILKTRRKINLCATFQLLTLKVEILSLFTKRQRCQRLILAMWPWSPPNLTTAIHLLHISHFFTIFRSVWLQRNLRKDKAKISLMRFPRLTVYLI